MTCHILCSSAFCIRNLAWCYGVSWGFEQYRQPHHGLAWQQLRKDAQIWWCRSSTWKQTLACLLLKSSRKVFLWRIPWRLGLWSSWTQETCKPAWMSSSLVKRYGFSSRAANAHFWMIIYIGQGSYLILLGTWLKSAIILTLHSRASSPLGCCLAWASQNNSASRLHWP